MAGIDKIYCDSYKDFMEFWNWCDKFKDLITKDLDVNIFNFFYYTPDEVEEYYGKDGYVPFGFCMTNLCQPLDKWMYKHCPVPFIRQRLSEQYLRPLCKTNEIELFIDR